MAGALEDLFRELNEDLVSDLQAMQLRPHHLRQESLSLPFPEVWQSTISDRILRMQKRRNVVDAVNRFYASDDVIDLEKLSHLGIHDGRTVGPDHFEALWEGLCLAGPAASVWASPQHKTAVATIAAKRNLIAHFEADPRVEAFRFTYGDLAISCQRVLETIERLQEHTTLWLDRHAL